jgi:hypothetical protein
MNTKIHDQKGAVVPRDGVVWAVFISVVVVFGFLTVMAVSSSTITPQQMETGSASAVNTVVRDVDIKVVPVTE